ncbi:hypothetical protein MMC19_002076 [Ptychographa xylographoides]|nr:hypothetical protein [Ptychographa xylographoides]
MPSPRSLIFLTGAPEVGALQWGTEDLTESLLPSFASNTTIETRKTLPLVALKPVWRAIPLHPQIKALKDTTENRYKWQQGPESYCSPDVEESLFPDKRISSFISAEDPHDGPLVSEEAKEALTDFYEHSFAMHEYNPSTQIASAQSYDCTSGLSTASDLSSSLQRSNHMDIHAQKPVSGHITNLQDVPNATYLQSITPQTMTVDLIVGIISLPKARTIHMRRGGRSSELIEMTVADETKAGFGINLWLASVESLSRDLKAIVGNLRVQDVILIRTVALTSFRGIVYGQSLRGNMTKIDVMFRNPVDERDLTGIYNVRDLERLFDTDPQIAKVKRVQEWVMQFVGISSKNAGQRWDGPSNVLQILPPDTQ